MPEGKGAKGTKVTLKAAKKAIRMTPDGSRRLTLSNMGITVFPKCLFKLTNIDELDLSRNLIQKLPENIGNLPSLKWLDLHTNKLTCLPESIGNMVSLVHLNLSNNRLTSAGLPSMLGSLTSLKSLNLGMNQIDALPPTLEALESLQELGLFDNLFIKVPEFLKGQKNLMKVNMKRNPYSHGEGERKELKEDAYLVHKSNLCRTCLKKYQVQRREEGGRGGRGGRRRESDVLGKKTMRTFSGLMTPNSVAIVRQDIWRMKENVKHKQIK